MNTYDPALVVPSFAGNKLGGFADGTFIEVERNEDGFTLAVGASGETVRAQSRNRSGRITFTVLQSSVTNDILSAMANDDELLGTGVGEFQLVEINGTTLVHAQNAWVMKAPKIERGKEISNVVWVLEADSIEIYAGGLL